MSISPRSSNGVPVFGGGISRQLDTAGVTVSLLGTLHLNIDVETAPALSPAEVAGRLEAAQGARLVAERRPALVVLTLPDGSHTLSYRIAMSDGRFHYADAGDGRILHVADAFRTQSAGGAGSDSRGAGARSSARRGPEPGSRPATICAPRRSSPSTGASTSCGSTA